MQPILEIKSISKKFRIQHERSRYLSLRDSVTNFLKNPIANIQSSISEEFWALKNISFEVNPGESIGIIGKNGAGKSTLLKILSKITPPTEGKIISRGRIASLLEVGTGFHPELSGRENIFLNGSILGMKHKEIQKKFDEIVDFSGVEQFLDTPLKHYSSGMQLRLAFAVAAFLESEIMVIDEVLAVGDSEFQKKCIGKMDSISKNEGRALLFVSHNLTLVQNLCSRSILLKKGILEYNGETLNAIHNYINNNEADHPLNERKDRMGSGEIIITKITLKDNNDNVIDSVYSGQDIKICLSFINRNYSGKSNIVIGINVKTQFDIPVFLTHNRMTSDIFSPIPPSGEFVCYINKIPLPVSNYSITYSIIADNQYIDGMSDALKFMVVGGDFYRSGELPPISHGLCLVDSKWKIKI